MEFSEKVCERFRKKSMVDVIEEFNKLKQTGSVESYQVHFEEFKVSHDST